MPTKRRIFGDLGEKIAQKFLEEKGYQIIDNNYSKQWGEIDLIAKSPDNFLVFVEVKTREIKHDSYPFLPEDSVNYSKQQKIIKTAKTFLYENRYPEDTFWRIDVISIEINTALHKAKIRHLKNAVEM